VEGAYDLAACIFLETGLVYRKGLTAVTESGKFFKYPAGWMSHEQLNVWQPLRLHEPAPEVAIPRF
jgi:hypothetical protein